MHVSACSWSGGVGFGDECCAHVAVGGAEGDDLSGR